MLRSLLASLPCGCVVDPVNVQFHHVLGPGLCGVLVCCPWCESVFNAIEFFEWSRYSEEVLIQFNAALQILTQGGRVLEIVGMCGKCSSPMVREPRDRAVEHLEAGVPVQMLRN